MYVTMQGDWTVAVKSKSASFDQRFVISGSDNADNTYTGTVGTSVNVRGRQWTITIQNDPGGGFQPSTPQIQFPRRVGNDYVFDIRSNDAGSDEDFNDLILTCSTPGTILDHLIYGKVSTYSGFCYFNPCRLNDILVIDTHEALLRALRNPKLYDCIKRYYPERLPIDPPDPALFDPQPEPPEPFRPIVLDALNLGARPKTSAVYEQIEAAAPVKGRAKSKAAEDEQDELSLANFTLLEESGAAIAAAAVQANPALREAVQIGKRLALNCQVEPADSITLSFEEYDRTAAERAGGPYTGDGNRQLLGDTITDSFGNYIFRYRHLELERVPGFLLPRIRIGRPDIIVKVIGQQPYEILYESAPYYDVPNLKRINLCLPKAKLRPTSICFNGNLIGSLGNVFIGGNQNTSASLTTTALTRDGYNNRLDRLGKISVANSQAGFSIDCAAWGGTIDMKGCMYDLSKPASQNTIEWYTIRIRRSTSSRWEYVSQQYLHPRFSKRHLPGYNGDLVGPFSTALNVDGRGVETVPAYKNIQRETFALGVDWEFSSLDRYMRLNTHLYDNLPTDPTAPGTFFVQVNGYNGAGNPVANATDLIALYIHNKPLAFAMSSISLDGVTPDPCNLYRINSSQSRAPMRFSFQAADPFGFVDRYTLSTSRCPSPTIALDASPMADLVAGNTILQQSISGSTAPVCSGFTGTIADFSSPGMINVTLQPPVGGSWVQAGEIFTRYNLALTAHKRVTNGYNTGIDDNYRRYADIFIQPIGVTTP